jgi:spore maturation protein CgeB
MRFLIVDTDYSAFLNWLYSREPGLRHRTYDQQMRARAQSFFGCGVSYATNLNTLGHEAHQIFFNNKYLQQAWAREHGLNIKPHWQFGLRRGVVPWLVRREQDWLYRVLSAQIEYYKPDVLLNNAMHLSPSYFRRVKPYVRMLAGSHGSPLPEDRDFGAYDLVFSVVANFVDYFRAQGLKSELLRLAFEPLVLERFNGRKPSIPVSFVGQLSSAHPSRLQALEFICSRIPVQVWAPSLDGVPGDSPVIRCHRGKAWGIEMYDVLQKSMMTLNHHIDVAGEYAGNARLFEATGIGTLLITDWKKNLHEMFEPGREVIAYRSPDECVELVRYYLEHDREREAVARAGQQRTLREHTFDCRMQELADIIEKYLDKTSHPTSVVASEC